MKKFTLMAVALVAISLASCKKDHTCKCTTTQNNGDVDIEEYTLTETKKGDAKDACANYGYTETNNGKTSMYKVACELK